MKFSIITVNFNHAEGLQNTIRSVIGQSYKNYEYIIVDGGSTDGSVDIIRSYEADLTYWVSEPDGGIYQAMNKGTKMATGDYCIYLNSGDIFSNIRVLENVAGMSLTEDIISGDQQIGTKLLRSPDFVTLKIFFIRSLFHQATFIKTNLIKTHPYDESMKFAADWKFFMEMIVLNNSTYKHIPLSISIFESGGATEQNTQKSRDEVRGILENIFPKRVLEDYNDYCYGETPYRKMMNKIEDIPPVKKIIYTIDVAILKIINIRIKSKWIRELGFFLINNEKSRI
ncbi:glycosyl transferase [Prevotella dentalis DSM 3688]|uniref:Glycosyl transferase n=1 Tax=Prevotella dentalis (strain ATCC 49559 / DSM 3688 / JCM 13448 / NCTC 12043 / ES 2772) TaxID=908937 RepID=F9D6B8_PREDD|nr:glycosyltransferase family 2 protein [Prevotella dentalis]AGB29483.1 glycosyl transferase [Prevotella dentalis DSM 3688]EGQ12513.1 glycosyl transferase [Prevotella dentalis DSM 3688]